MHLILSQYLHKRMKVKFQHLHNEIKAARKHPVDPCSDM